MDDFYLDKDKNVENKSTTKICSDLPLNQYYQYNAVVQTSVSDSKKVDDFKNRISKFAEISTLEEAVELSDKILPVKNELNRLFIGNLVCTVVKKKNLFRICLDTESEFICYDFA